MASRIKHLLRTDTFHRGEFGWQSGFTADDSPTLYFPASMYSCVKYRIHQRVVETLLVNEGSGRTERSHQALPVVSRDQWQCEKNIEFAGISKVNCDKI